MPETVSERAAAIFASGLAGDQLVRERGGIGQPIPVHGSAGDLHSWFVPVTVGEKLAGFLQLLPDLALMRYSSFQRRESSLEGCPEAALWIDPERIRTTARSAAGPEDELGEPVLTFDGAPDRLAWAVPASTAAGEQRRIFVAGEAAWVERPGAGAGLG